MARLANEKASEQVCNMQLIWISTLGLVGVLARYGADRALQDFNLFFPSSTLAVNVLGCLIAGLIFGFGEKSLLEPQMQAGLLVGFCGGFTTFSAYAIQAADLLQKEKILAASLYFVGSPILGIISAFLGILIARRVF